VLKRPGQPSRLRAADRKGRNNAVRSATGRDAHELPTRLTADSDSEPDIQYRDNDRRSHVSSSIFKAPLNPTEDDEEEPELTSGLAALVCRKDTLAMRRVLENAPEKVDDIPDQTANDRLKLMHRVSIKLERKLSERPSADELEQRNILKAKEAESLSRHHMDEARRLLLRKLSFRPTIQELKEKQIIKFNDYVEVTERPRCTIGRRTSHGQD